MAVNKILTESKMTSYFHEPAGTTAEDVAYVSQRDFDGLAVGYLRCVTAGSLTALSIIVSDDASGTTTAVVKSHALGSNPDAVGDQIYLEASNEEILAAAEAAGISGVELYVSAQVTEAVATQDSAIIYCQPGLFKKDALTVDVVA